MFVYNPVHLYEFRHRLLWRVAGGMGVSLTCDKFVFYSQTSKGLAGYDRPWSRAWEHGQIRPRFDFFTRRHRFHPFKHLSRSQGRGRSGSARRSPPPTAALCIPHSPAYPLNYEKYPWSRKYIYVL